MIYGIGIDIVEIKRIRNLLDRWQEKFLHRVFTEKEIEYCQKKSNPSSHYAVRFAAKEATGKMFGTGLGNIGWKDIEVLHKDNGNPYLNFRNNAEKEIINNNIKNVHLSLSHEKKYAVAQVVAEGGK